MKDFTRKTYEKVKKMDPRDMKTFFEDTYKEGYEAGKKSEKALLAAGLEKIKDISGIGPKKIAQIEECFKKDCEV